MEKYKLKKKDRVPKLFREKNKEEGPDRELFQYSVAKMKGKTNY